jgi:hypothetical protein
MSYQKPEKDFGEAPKVHKIRSSPLRKTTISPPPA